MRKYILTITTAVIALALFLTGNKYLGKSVSVSVSKPLVTRMEDFVVCSGRLEEKAKSTVYTDGTGYVKEFYVNIGDNVKKGQAIAIWVKKGTASLQQNTGIESYTDSDISKILPSGYDTSILTQQSSSAAATAEQEIELTAPADGCIIELNKNADGSSSKSVAVISDLSTLFIKININESYISKVKTGQEAIISGEGFKNKIYYGVIDKISPTAKQVVTSGFSETVVEAVVIINNPDKDIRPGFTADVKIVTNIKNNTISVPYEAIAQDSDNKEYVYVIENAKTVKKEVVTGLENEKGIEIISGLNNDDIIVTTPVSSLDEDIKTKPQKKVGN